MSLTPSSIKAKLFQVISNAEKHIPDFVHYPGRDMTRHRDCTFSDTILATLCFSMNRTNTELFRYFSSVQKHIPSKSAFCQQRKKLNGRLFPHLLKTFYNAFPVSNKYRGYTLMAVDGSDINIPVDKKDLVYRVKQARSDNYYYQMHLNALYNICDNRFHSIVIQPRPQMNENAAFCRLIDESDFDQKTIFLADRGYISLNTLAHLQEHNKLFLIRAKAPSSSGSFLAHLVEPNLETDKLITIGITRSPKNIYGKNPHAFKLIRSDRIFEPIPPQNHDSVYFMTLRIVCLQLDNGNYEYLVTNLPADEFSTSDLKVLYHKRWSIETSFRSLKYAVSLVYLHSVNRELIIQEIYAKLILYNFASLLHACAEKERQTLNRKTKHPYRVSFDDTIPVAQSLLMRNIMNKKVKALLLRHLTSIRDSVSKPRFVRSQSAKPLNNRA